MLKKSNLDNLKKPILMLLVVMGAGFALAKPAYAGELANQFTISIWTKPQTSIASKTLIVKDSEIRLVTDASGNPLCQIHNGTAWQTAATSSTALTTGSWQHVGCTYDKSNYNYALSQAQIRKVMLGGAAMRFGPNTGSP